MNLKVDVGDRDGADTDTASMTSSGTYQTAPGSGSRSSPSGSFGSPDISPRASATSPISLESPSGLRAAAGAGRGSSFALALEQASPFALGSRSASFEFDEGGRGDAELNILESLGKLLDDELGDVPILSPQTAFLAERQARVDTRTR